MPLDPFGHLSYTIGSPCLRFPFSKLIILNNSRFTCTAPATESYRGSMIVQWNTTPPSASLAYWKIGSQPLHAPSLPAVSSLPGRIFYAHCVGSSALAKPSRATSQSKRTLSWRRTARPALMPNVVLPCCPLAHRSLPFAVFESASPIHWISYLECRKISITLHMLSARYE